MIQGDVLARAWRFEPSLMYQQKQKLRALFLSYDHPLNVLKLSLILSLDHPVSPSALTRCVPLLHSPGRWSHFPDTRHPGARLPRGADGPPLRGGPMGGRQRTSAVSDDLFGHALLSPLPEGEG